MAERRYVNVRLVVEDIGVIDENGRNSTRMYNLYDPNGILDGDLELVCTEGQLEGELAKLSPVIPSTTFPTINRYDSNTKSYSTPSYDWRKTSTTSSSGDKSLHIKHLEAPAEISAGSLVDAISKETGTQSVFTRFLVELIDDFLRPQK